MLTADILGPDMLVVIVVAVVVLLFGGSKLPKLARGLGTASHELKKGLEEGDDRSESQAPSPPVPDNAPAAPQSCAAETPETAPKHPASG